MTKTSIEFQRQKEDFIRRARPNIKISTFGGTYQLLRISWAILWL